VKDDLRKSAKWHLDQLKAKDYVGESVMPILEAYIADHPADDNKPITREWLREIGFVDVESHIGLGYDDDMQKGDFCVWDFNDQCWFITGLDGVGYELKTRRQIRLLLEVFRERTND